MVKRGEEILLSRRRRGFGRGLWQHSFVGKVEEGETEAEAAVREFKEESGMGLGLGGQLRPVAKLFYEFEDDSICPHVMEVHLFSVGFQDLEGVPRTTAEAEPKWFPLQNIPYSNMWPDNVAWLPQLLQRSLSWPPEEVVLAYFLYTSMQNFSTHQVEFVPLGNEDQSECNKRQRGLAGQSAQDEEEECMFGTSCFRLNPHHFVNYSHPHLLRLCLDHPDSDPPPEALKPLEVTPDVALAQIKVLRDVCKVNISKARKKNASVDSSPEQNSSKKGPSTSCAIQQKLSWSSPVSLFLTKVRDSAETHQAKDSIYFSDLLHPSLGDLKRSLQITFMVEWDWLWMNYGVHKQQVRATAATDVTLVIKTVSPFFCT